MANRWSTLVDRWDALQRRAYRAALWAAALIVCAGAVAYAIDTWGIFHDLSPDRLIITP